MLRLTLVAFAVFMMADIAFAQRHSVLYPGGHVDVRTSPGGVSVNVGHPFGGFRGHFPAPRYFDPLVVRRPFDGYFSPHGTYYNPQTGHVEHFLPPIHYPAELMYGPLAVRQFFGLDRIPPTVAAPPVVAAPALRAEAAGEAIEAPAPKVRESNLASRERAAHYLSAGDELYRAQKHHEALQRYKSAAQWAPDLSETYFRQGFALIATNRHELAADAFRRGLTLDPDWPNSDFRLDALYRDAALAKQAHQDALANAALHEPENADLLFDLGVFLHFDGQADRAKKFFTRAKELAADDSHIDGFLAAAP